MIITSTDYFKVSNDEGKVFGICEAFILARLRRGFGLYRTGYDDNDEIRYEKCKYWIHMPIKKLVNDLCMFSETTIKNSLKNLKEQKIILVTHYEDGDNRTNWYAINQTGINDIMRMKGIDYFEFEPF